MNVDLLTYIILPYLTIIVFICGLVWRIRTWWAKPRSGAVLYPAVKTKRNVVLRVIGDIMFFGKTFKISKSLWTMAILFHLGLLLVVLGHLRTIVEPGFIWGWLHLDGQGIENVSFSLGMIAGGIMLIGGILLFSRRFTPTMRVLSIFQDYFVLSMLLIIIFLGISMRLWAPIHAGEVQHYVRGVLTLHPAVEITNSLFLWHIFFAQVLIMYLPFSKLIHLVSKPVAESWTMR
jgi:nitrate reductase gamma subunit